NDFPKFTNVTDLAGHAFERPEVSRGAAFGDLTNRGRIDIVTTNNNGPARVFLNQSPAVAWVEVLLEGNGRINRDALGARVTLHRDGAPDLVRRVHTDSSYCSASDRRVHFGLGSNARIRSIEVLWPDGAVETWDAPQPYRLLKLVRGTGHSH